MDKLDLVGIGIGPFNLSLAAQLDGISDVKSAFLDQKAEFAWHPDMMLPGVELQTSFLKDLVTLTNPTSKWSFLAYIVNQKRMLDFMNADFAAVPRREFAAYLKWVAGHLDGLIFGNAVREVAFDGKDFQVCSDRGVYTAKNLAVGIGKPAFVPNWARHLPTEKCFHTSQAKSRLPDLRGKRVAVIGGGQSGAELVEYLLGGNRDSVEEVLWLSRRDNFEPLDDTPFVNEYFTPGYADVFANLPDDRKQELMSRQKLASDGASLSTLKSIYQLIYRQRYLDEGDVVGRLLPQREVFQVQYDGEDFRIAARNGLNQVVEFFHADALILATGYETALPEFMAPLRARLEEGVSGAYRLDANFRACWDGPADRGIFVQNAGRIDLGIFEPQLSLMAWRSAKIVNALLGQDVFDLEQNPPIVDWLANGTSMAGDAVVQAWG
ncbi:lysine N(6)-hydroxylase/L-ornithine N(5)-oxygenase family protein [Thalassospira lucentensis]|uniref:lysine N(6)-hydroxylase/L-ornithine N(5)-oxygenase family protein n=1 Tax=Thalassospira lucentensis TaxID=168935 RepID=UPI003D2F09B0